MEESSHIWIVKADMDYRWPDGFGEGVVEDLIAAPTYNQALEHLHQIAKELDVEIEKDDNSFSLPGETVGSAEKFVTYYIDSVKWEA